MLNRSIAAIYLNLFIICIDPIKYFFQSFWLLFFISGSFRHLTCSVTATFCGCSVGSKNGTFLWRTQSAPILRHSRVSSSPPWGQSSLHAVRTQTGATQNQTLWKCPHICSLKTAAEWKLKCRFPHYYMYSFPTRCGIITCKEIDSDIFQVCMMEKKTFVFPFIWVFPFSSIDCTSHLSIFYPSYLASTF